MAKYSELNGESQVGIATNEGTKKVKAGLGEPPGGNCTSFLCCKISKNKQKKMFRAEAYNSKKGLWLKVTGWLLIILESMRSKTITIRVLYVEG